MSEQIIKPIVHIRNDKSKGLIERLYKPSLETQALIRLAIGEDKK